MALLTFFVLISASFSYVSSFAHLADHHALQNQTSIAAAETSIALPSAMAQPDEPGSETSKDECACKDKTGATKFVCSVTLAFSSNAETLYSPAKSRARYAIAKSAALQSHIDELKRPPRTIL